LAAAAGHSISKMHSPSAPSLSAVDLFAGAGGFSLGATKAGFDVIAAVDHWKPALRTYERNFEHPVLDRDLASVSPSDLRRELNLGHGELDLLIGGPPCQGFSIQRIGKDPDDRNDLVLMFGRAVAEFAPRLFMMENVRGLLGRRGRPYLDSFVALVTEAGYEVEVHQIDASNYGVPQARKRVFVCGVRGERPTPFQFPSPTHSDPVSVWDVISDLPSPPIDLTPHPEDSLHRRSRLSALNKERLRHIPPGGGFEDLPKELRVRCHRPGAAKIGHRYVYGRLDPKTPAGTITARFDSFTRGKFAHPFEDRNITLREGARLQTFPDEHEFAGTQEEIAALIGNAVPPKLGDAVCAAARDFLHGEQSAPRQSQASLLSAVS
jgi:DNA (cytosine-5)-methyltransferase 1